MARKNKSAFEETFGFLGNIVKSAKSALTFGVSNLTSDYNAWVKKREKESLSKRQNVKNFLSDSKSYFDPTHKASFWTTPAAKKLGNVQMKLAKTRPVQDVSNIKLSVSKNVRDFSGMIKAGPKYFNPDQATSGANFWTSRPAQDLAKLQLHPSVQLGIRRFPDTRFMDESITPSLKAGLVMANKQGIDIMQGRGGGLTGLIAKAGYYGTGQWLLPKSYKNKIEDSTEEWNQKLMASAMADQDKLQTYLQENPLEADTQGLSFQQKIQDPDWVVRGLLLNIPSLLISLGVTTAVTVATKNPALGYAAGFGPAFAMEGGSSYLEALEAGEDEKTARSTGIVVGTINAIFEMMTPGAKINDLLGPKLKSSLLAKMTNFVKDVLREGTTESIQEIISNVGKAWYDENAREVDDIIAGTAESGFFGMLLGGGANIATAPFQGTGANILPVDTSVVETTQEDVKQPSVSSIAYQQTIKNGGVTIDLAGKQQTQGFSYSPYPQNTVIVPEVEFSEKSLEDFETKNYDLLSQAEHFIGTWDEEGEIHIDVVRVGPPTVETVQKAIDATQLAAFDLASLEGGWDGNITLGKREGGVYTANDEATNIFDQYTRQAQRPSGERGVESIPEVQEGILTDQATKVTSEVVSTPKSRFKTGDELIKFIDFKGNGAVGVQLNPAEIEQLKNHVTSLNTPENTKWQGVIYKNQAGKRDLVLGVVPDPTTGKVNLFIVATDMASGLGKIRTHATSVSENKIIDKIDINTASITQEVLPEPAPKALPSETLMSAKEKQGKDIQEQMDKESEELPSGEEVFTDRGVFSKWVNGTKSWKKELSNIFATWANSLNASFVGEIRAKEQFKKYDSEGMDGILSIQHGEKGHKDVRKFFDTWHKRLKDAGVPIGYWENYMPGVWENSGQETEKSYTRKVSKNPNFSMKKVFSSYQEGIDYGLTPRYKTVGELAGWYERVAQTAIANREFFNYLYANKYVLQDRKAPFEWINLDNQAFFKYETRIDDKIYRGTYKASPELANAINTIVGKPSGPLAGLAKLTSTIKGVILSSGIPGTGITFHSFNVLSRYINSASNPLKAALKGGLWMIKPSIASKTVKTNINRFEKFVAVGMTGSSEDQGINMVAKEVQGKLVKRGYIKLKNWQEKTFEHNLFQKLIPAMKLDFAEDTYTKLKEKGIEEKEAMRQAAGLSNEVFGGINVEQIARNKDFQNILRSVFLASDWMETNVRLGVGQIRAITPGQRSKLTAGQKMVYTRMVRNFVAMVLVYSVFGKMLSDKWPWENEKGNEFNVDTGLFSSTGQKIYLRPFGTSLDYIRLPYDIAKAAMSGDFSTTGKTIRNRLSPLLSFGMGALTDRDYAGRPIGYRGVDRWGNPMGAGQRIGGVVSELMGLTFPSFMRSPIDYAAGRVSGEEAITRAAELPLRYSGGAFTDKQKQERYLLKTAGATNEEVFEHFQNERDKSKLEKEAKKIFKKKGEGSFSKWIDKVFGGDLDGDERIDKIKVIYDVDETLETEATTIVEIAKLENEKLGLAKRIWENSEEIPGMTEEEKAEIIEEIGLDIQDVEYYSTASETGSIKLAFVEDLLSRTENSEKLSTLAALRYEVGGKEILSSGVIDDLYNLGYLTKEEKKYLKAIIWDKKNNTFTKKAGTDVSTKKIKLKISNLSPQLTKFKVSGYKSGGPPIRTSALTANLPKFPTQAPAFGGGTGYRVSNLSSLAVKNLVPLGLKEIGKL